MDRIVLHPTKCVGCRVCEGICSLVNEGESNPVNRRIKVVAPSRTSYFIASRFSVSSAR